MARYGVEVGFGVKAGLMKATQILFMTLLAISIAGCQKLQDKTSFLYHPVEKMLNAPPPVIRQPVLPELLKPCRGHVLVPALGMKFVPRGGKAPDEQFLREERISAPYRIIRPRARVTQDHSPARLNVEIDEYERVVGLYCG